MILTSRNRDVTVCQETSHIREVTRRKGHCMEEKMIGVAEVARRLDVSQSYAYKLVRRLNEEMEAAGNITIPGKVSESYFNERFFTKPVNSEESFDGRQ